MPAPSSKRKRKSKRSNGVNGAKRHRLSEIEKVLMGKGLLHQGRAK